MIEGKEGGGGNSFSTWKSTGKVLKHAGEQYNFKIAFAFGSKRKGNEK